MGSAKIAAHGARRHSAQCSAAWAREGRTRLPAWRQAEHGCEGLAPPPFQSPVDEPRTSVCLLCKTLMDLLAILLSRKRAVRS